MSAGGLATPLDAPAYRRLAGFFAGVAARLAAGLVALALAAAAAGLPAVGLPQSSQDGTG